MICDARSRHGRAQEVGIRVAVGASARSVVRATAAPAFRAFAGGMAIGLLASALLARLLRRLVFGVEPLDVWSLGIACGVLLPAGLAAAVVPALRAVRIDPLEALRTG